jgi:hypothetical protein
VKDVIVWPIGRWKDMPEALRPAFEKIPGGVPDVAYENGRFYKVVNVKTHPLDWPVAVKIPLEAGDALVLADDFGVYGRILGAWR